MRIVRSKLGLGFIDERFYDSEDYGKAEYFNPGFGRTITGLDMHDHEGIVAFSQRFIPRKFTAFCGWSHDAHFISKDFKEALLVSGLTGCQVRPVFIKTKDGYERTDEIPLPPPPKHCGAEVDNEGVLILHRCMEDFIPMKEDTLSGLFKKCPAGNPQGYDAFTFFLNQYVEGHLKAKRPGIGIIGLKYLESIGFKIPTIFYTRLGVPLLP